MKHASPLLLLAALSGPVWAAPLAQWNFNTDDGQVASGTLLPSLGSGALSLVGGATGFFTSGSPSDPAAFPLDSAWSVGGYPAQGSASGTVGLAGFVSTSGQQDISLSFDYKTQPSGNKWYSVQASTDGGASWFDVETFGVAAADTWFTRTVAISSLVPAANDNAGFGFRVLAVFAPGTTAYEASEAGYNGDFGLVYDQLTVHATPVPEPALAWLVASGLLAGLALRKRVG